MKYNLIHNGKVRDIYNIDDSKLALVATNRQSAFDRDICIIPSKGTVLNLTSEYWFKKTKHIINNHYISAKDNVMIVKKCTVFPIEVVVRSYITGSTKTSLWNNYKSGKRTYCGINFPEGLKKNQKLDNIILTPTTKGLTDIPLSPEELIDNEYCTKEEWDFISEKALEVFKFSQELASSKGLILVDTKYEFGRDCNDEIILVDEVNTCDSSRYWLQETYQERFDNNEEPERFDKDVVRRYIKTLCDPYEVKELPEVPDEKIKEVKETYIKFYEMLTNSEISEKEVINLDELISDLIT